MVNDVRMSDTIAGTMLFCETTSRAEKLVKQIFGKCEGKVVIADLTLCSPKTGPAVETLLCGF